MEKKKKAQQKANENKEKKQKAKQARAAAKADQLQATLAGLAAKTYPPFNDDEFVVTSLFNYSEDMKTTGAGIAHYFEDGWATGKICLVPASADYYWVKFPKDDSQVCGTPLRSPLHSTPHTPLHSTPLHSTPLHSTVKKTPPSKTPPSGEVHAAALGVREILVFHRAQGDRGGRGRDVPFPDVLTREL